MASKSIYIGLVALIVATGVSAQSLTITPAADASETAAMTSTSSTTTSTGEPCPVQVVPIGGVLKPSHRQRHC